MSPFYESMKAVILVGGQGTRLLPLTANRPKPLIPLVNRPFLDHVLNLLRAHGIQDVALAIAHLAENFEQAYGDGSQLGMKLAYVREIEPMGTGGGIKNVEKYLEPDQTFVVFNGDILTDLDLTDMLRFHRENGSLCTISLTSVDDPSAYGVVDMDEDGHIQRFTEKPKREDATSNWINAGTYILEPEVLEYIPAGQHYMVERGLFPILLAEGKPLYGYRTGAYWLDIGTPAKYLQAQEDLLAGRLKLYLAPEGELLWDRVWAGEGTFVHSEARIAGPVVLGKGCKVGPGVSITGPVILGDGCQVCEGAQLERLVAWNGVEFGAKSQCKECLIANDVKISGGSQVEGMAVVGDNAVIDPGQRVADGARVQPGPVVGGR